MKGVQGLGITKLHYLDKVNRKDERQKGGGNGFFKSLRKISGQKRKFIFFLERERRIIRIRGERERIWSDNDTCGKNLGSLRCGLRTKIEFSRENFEILGRE